MLKKLRHLVGKRFHKQIQTFLRMRNAVAKTFFYFFPVSSQKIVFINFNGKGFGCNPKYIALELLSRGRDYDMVWLVDSMNAEMPERIRKVRYSGLRALYEIATARVIVTNVKNDLRLIKKKKQYIIQTWHASFAAKEVEASSADKLSPEYIRQSRKNSAQTDLFLSNSRIMSQSYREDFWCRCEIYECGYPRNDVLFSQTPDSIRQIRERIGIPSDYSLALYAPTFRDDGSLDAYNIDCLGILNTLNHTGRKWKLLTRLHPNVSARKDLFPEHEDIVDASGYPDMQELLVAGDILITDYSSTVYEFAAMNKQSYIYAPDLEEYDRLRGLTPAFFRLPYKICRTNGELLKEMESYSPEKAKESAGQFMDMVGGVDDGRASRRVAERIDKVIDGSYKQK